LAAALFYFVQYFPFPSLGFEWMLYIGALTGWLSVLSSIIKVVICVVSYFRSGTRFMWQFSGAVAAGSVILILAAFPGLFR
jgi:hypothetical protein